MNAALVLLDAGLVFRFAGRRARPKHDGHASTGTRVPGICFGSLKEVNSTKRALDVGSLS
jgi:hypothetical protein